MKVSGRGGRSRVASPRGVGVPVLGPGVDVGAPGTTGRYLVLLRPDAIRAGMRALTDAAGLHVASAADFEGGVVDPDRLAGGAAIVFDRLGVAVVDTPPEQLRALSATATEESGILIACVVVAAAPVFVQSAHSGSPTQTARATFVNQQGEQVGTVTAAQTPNGVLVNAEITGLPPGEHGFRIHETGRCDPTTGFESAGEHYAPEDHKHGYLVGGGPHAGDMPNQFVGQDGRLHAHVFNPNVTLDSGPSTLFDDDGSAFIVHANADDYRSQPSGDAGGRTACAVIQR